MIKNVNLKNRSNVINNQTRSIPQMLVMVFLAAVGLSIILQFVVPYAMMRIVSFWTPGPTFYLSLLMHLSAFPFWMTCVVWLAARSGRTIWATWKVPLVLIVAPNLLGLIVAALAIAHSSPIVAKDMRITDLIYFQWASTFRSSLLMYVMLAFLFRATTLHLRPVEVDATPNRLTILTILLLTTVVAIVLSIDLLANQLVSTQVKAMYSQSRNQFNILVDIIQKLSTALIWFSAAWLLVGSNPKRWIGGVGLIVYVMLLGISILVITPLLMNQGPFPPGVTMPVFGPLYFVGTFAVSVFHILIVFLCVGMMHIAGYRWDIRRRLPENVVDIETQILSHLRRVISDPTIYRL